MLGCDGLDMQLFLFLYWVCPLPLFHLSRPPGCHDLWLHFRGLHLASLLPRLLQAPEGAVEGPPRPEVRQRRDQQKAEGRKS